MGMLLPLRDEFVFSSTFEKGFAESGAASTELTGEGEVGAVTGVGKMPAAFEIVQIKKRAIVDVVELVVLERIVLVAAVLTSVDVRQ